MAVQHRTEEYRQRFRNLLPIEERLWGAAVRDGECLIWRPDAKSKRYGLILFGGRRLGAHTVAYRLTKGEIPKGLYVLHSCDRPRCIEPSHLALGTAGDNARDGHRRGRYPIGERHPARTRPETRPRGEKHPQAKLTAERVGEIRQRLRNSEQGKALAAEYGVSASQISRIRKGLVW